MSSKSRESETGNQETMEKGNHLSKETVQTSVFCLIDHPQIWKKLGNIGVDISKNKRLMSLAFTPKNKIVRLPNATKVMQQFECVMCKEIPFPRKIDKKHCVLESTIMERGPFVCEMGHTICTLCFKACSRCPSFKKKPENESKRANEFFGSPLTWGGLDTLCLSYSLPYTCHFLAEMIMSTEFACKYFYSWCAYRGKGKELLQHERNCSCKPSIQPNFSSITGRTPQDQAPNYEDDDGRILIFDEGQLVADLEYLLIESKSRMRKL